MPKYKKIQYINRTWDKLWAKRWIQEHTTFPVAEDLGKNNTFFLGSTDVIQDIHSLLAKVPWPRFILKPTSSTRSQGIVMLAKLENGKYWSPFYGELDPKGILRAIQATVSKRSQQQHIFAEEYLQANPWFARLSPMMQDSSVLVGGSPIVRTMISRNDFLVGRINIPNPAYHGVTQRKYHPTVLAFDVTGTIRRLPESAKGATMYKSLLEARVGDLDMEGVAIPSYVEAWAQIKEKIIPVFTRDNPTVHPAYRSNPWTVDAIITERGYTVVELEHGPATPWQNTPIWFRKPSMRPENA